MPARGTMHSAPGRLWASRPAARGPRREVLSLDWDRSGRVTPAQPASQEAWPGAESGGHSPGESRSRAPEGERAPKADELRRLRTLVCGARRARKASADGDVCRCRAALVGCASRRSAPSFVAGGESIFVRGRGQSSGTMCRENGAARPPPRSGGGGPPEGWWRGLLSIRFRSTQIVCAAPLPPPCCAGIATLRVAFLKQRRPEAAYAPFPASRGRMNC